MEAKECNTFFAFLWFIRERKGEKIWWADEYPLPLPTDGRSTNAMAGWHTARILNNKKLSIMATKFYKCAHCGNVVHKVVDKGVPVFCCGQKMEELEPNTVDASGEKHVPVVTRVDDCRLKVEVGSVAHPMLPEHHIAFVYVECEQGGIRVDLTDKPEAEVCVCGNKPVAVYEYCNLHGLWKTEL